MADIRVTWDPALLEGDDVLDGSDLDGTNELVTAVAISLFTHRTAEADDILPNADQSDAQSSRRGWWADYQAAELYPGATPIGSRLWLLSREKQTEDTRNRAEDYIREALAWMIDVRLATQIDLDVAWFARGRLGALITIYRGSAKSIAVQFDQLWEAL